MTIRFLLRIVKLALLTLVAIALGTTYVIAIEPNWVHVVPVTVPMPHLDPEFEGYRIAQISDLHIGAWKDGDLPVSRLQRFIPAVNAQHPDLIAFTGDLVTHIPSEATVETAIATLGRLSAPDGVVGVLGNHDHWSDADRVRSILSASGTIDISNDVYTVQRGDNLLTVAGVDDVRAGQDHLDLVLDQLPETGATILLAHEPDFADISAATGRFDLQLSGHSHGGQVRLPFVTSIQLPPLAEKYPRGQYRVRDMIEYTNIGLGTIWLPIRFLSRPEITVLTLESA